MGSYYTIMNTFQLSIYTSMNTFIDLKLFALALQNILDTLSNILVKCLRLSLIKIVCLNLPSQAKMLSSVLIKN
jgi:hypothetical protein